MNYRLSSVKSNIKTCKASIILLKKEEKWNCFNARKYSNRLRVMFSHLSQTRSTKLYESKLWVEYSQSRENSDRDQSITWPIVRIYKDKHLNILIYLEKHEIILFRLTMLLKGNRKRKISSIVENVLLYQSIRFEAPYSLKVTKNG